jgi:hypothetical protein
MPSSQDCHHRAPVSRGMRYRHTRQVKISSMKTIHAL